jgi:hypothetical protein
MHRCAHSQSQRVGIAKYHPLRLRSPSADTGVAQRRTSRVVTGTRRRTLQPLYLRHFKQVSSHTTLWRTSISARTGWDAHLSLSLHLALLCRPSSVLMLRLVGGGGKPGGGLRTAPISSRKFHSKHSPQLYGSRTSADQQYVSPLMLPTDRSLSMELRLRLKGRYILECGGDGNCLFHVMSFLATKNPSNHAELRAKVADFYADAANAQHPVVRRLAMELAAGAGELRSLTTVPIYAEYIRRSGTMGSLVFELPILAEMLHLHVSVVIQEQAKPDSIVGQQLRDYHIDSGAANQKYVALLYVNAVSCPLLSCTAASTGNGARSRISCA